MTYSDRVTDIRNRYRVALTVVHAAEYRDVFNLPAPDEWGGDMTHAEWLDGFSTVDYPQPLGPDASGDPHRDRYGYRLAWNAAEAKEERNYDALAEEILNELLAERQRINDARRYRNDSFDAPVESLLDYEVPAGPETYASWLLGPTVMHPEVSHPPIWPHYIDNPTTE